MKLFVGLDVSKATLDACFLSLEDDTHTILWQTTVANSDAGARTLKNKIIEFHEKLEYDKIVVGMEATGQYSMHPSLFFSNDPDLQLLNVQTIVENPRVIHRFSKVWTDEKNDKLDAQLIAEFFKHRQAFSCSTPRREICGSPAPDKDALSANPPTVGSPTALRRESLLQVQYTDK